MKAPIFNSTFKRFTTRDSLGLQNVSSHIQSTICPIINVVTPHPFYWAFLVWNYYHFYSVPENRAKGSAYFNEQFVKRNDFFFVLCNHIAGKNMLGIVGYQNMAEIICPNKNAPGPFSYDPRYYSSRFGGMQYYNNGCIEMGFVPDDLSKININDNSKGARLTRLFDLYIKDTNIYKNYISKNILIDNVSREDLIELSNHLNLNLEDMDGIKEIIYENLFVETKKIDDLTLSEKYINLLLVSKILRKEDFNDLGILRKHLYGDIKPTILLGKEKLSEVLTQKVYHWEMVIANQYYVKCMEKIWHYLISILSLPCTLEDWIALALKNTKIDLEASPSSIEVHYTVEEIDQAIYAPNSPETIDSMLMVLLSIYNKYKGRLKDFDYAKLVANSDFCVFALINKIHANEFKTVKDLLLYLMKEHIIYRHEITAMRKRYQGRDNFYYEKSDGLYSTKGKETTVSNPSLRIINVYRVLSDLGKI